MRRYGSVIGVRPEKLNEYKRLHANPWPGVLDTLKKCNIRNYSIYQFGDRLFSYFEYVGEDFEADMARMAEDPVTQAWWRETDPCQFPLVEGEKWVPMPEVFHMD